MILRASCWLALSAAAAAAVLQKPLLTSSDAGSEITQSSGEQRKLTGRFLHITDIHPDPFFKYYTSTAEQVACHRGHGPAGYYGAETSDCDSPLSLVNATFSWLEANLKDKIDFIIWTGDSARHDNDEHHPRNVDQVLGQNRFLVNKFKEVFGSDEKGKKFEIPIIPSFGNNDILPHNIFLKGPNRWTKAYADIWRPFIPEEQRHGFDRGGWFYVEVIPGKLAVFSLNTMYFFDSNAAVSGCANPSQPGFEHMEWLRTQLQFLRERGVKAILSGHVPPARNDDKLGWDESCWQKYTLWLRQYRDVVVGSLYGHMNIEHFVLQDFGDIDIATAAGISEEEEDGDTETMLEKNGKVDIQVKAPDYLMALRELWADLPTVPDGLSVLGSREATDAGLDATKKKKSKKSKEQKFYEKIGGAYAQRFAVSHISASLVPNFYSTLRVFEYNITGLDATTIMAEPTPRAIPAWQERVDVVEEGTTDEDLSWSQWAYYALTRRFPSGMELTASEVDIAKKKKKKKHKKKKPKKPSFTVPDGPTPGSPPGPAYSPQTLSWLGYKQYVANNTLLNNDFTDSKKQHHNDVDLGVEGWNPGRYDDRQPGRRRKNDKPEPRNFTFELEYDTMDEKDEYRLGVGLTVRKWVELAARIGEYKGEKALINQVDDDEGGPEDENLEDDSDASDDSDPDSDSDDKMEAEKHKHKKKKHKKHKDKDKKRKKKRRKIVNRNWFAFVSRAVTGTMDDEELHNEFGEVDVDFNGFGDGREGASEWGEIWDGEEL